MSFVFWLFLQYLLAGSAQGPSPDHAAKMMLLMTSSLVILMGGWVTMWVRENVLVGERGLSRSKHEGSGKGGRNRAGDTTILWHVCDGRVEYSEGLLGLLGFEKDEIRGNFFAWQNLIHEDDLRDTLSMLSDVGIKPFEFRYRLLDNSGNYQAFHCVGRMQCDADSGKPLSVMVFHHRDDIVS